MPPRRCERSLIDAEWVVDRGFLSKRNAVHRARSNAWIGRGKYKPTSTRKQRWRPPIPCLLRPLTTLDWLDRAKEELDRALYEQDLTIKSLNETVEAFRVTSREEHGKNLHHMQYSTLVVNSHFGHRLSFLPEIIIRCRT